jgi:hypothetical protein
LRKVSTIVSIDCMMSLECCFEHGSSNMKITYQQLFRVTHKRSLPHPSVQLALVLCVCVVCLGLYMQSRKNILLLYTDIREKV